jgi:hypothetical protein
LKEENIDEDKTNKTINKGERVKEGEGGSERSQNFVICG